MKLPEGIDNILAELRKLQKPDVATLSMEPVNQDDAAPRFGGWYRRRPVYDDWKTPRVVCPLGLLPDADPTPTCVLHFHGAVRFTTDEIILFYKWWDKLTLEEAKTALDEIWQG